MPSTVNAVHYRWCDLSHDSPRERLDRQRVIGEKVMLSRVVLEVGCCVPTHSHENEQMACVLSGALRFGIGAEGAPERREVVVRAGEVLHLPSGVPHSADALETSVVLDVFSPPSEKTGIDGH